jgi:hypothetical protein
LPVEPFRYYQYGERTVHLDGCVEVEAAYYGAPPGWIGRRVPVQWDGRHVRLLNSIATSGPRLLFQRHRDGARLKTRAPLRRPHLNRFGNVLHISPLDLLRAGYAQTPVVCLVSPVDRHKGGELRLLIP